MNFDQQRAQRGNTERASDGLGLSEVNLHIIDAIPTLAWCARPGGSNEFLNRRWQDYTGLSVQEGLGWGWKVAIHPDDLGSLMAKWETLRASGESGESEARLRRSDAVYRWFLFRVEPLRDKAREVVEWYGTATDIENRKRTESLHAIEKRTLEMIADGASLNDILSDLCRSIDVQAPAMISTVLLMDPDGKRLWLAAGPHVPSDWLPAISPRPIGPREGCCGAAAFLKERVIVADVATDPIWPDEYRDLAIKNGLRAAWSQPILTKDGQLLGTFALYASAPRIPTDADLELIEGAGHIALIAIERQRSQEALRNALDEIRESEAELRRITDAIPLAINVLGVDGRTLYANKVTLEYAGLGLEDITSPGFRERLFHPQDVERVRNERQQGLAAGIPFELQQRVRRHDGQYRWFLIRYKPFRDEQGRVIRWYATGTDIEDSLNHQTGARAVRLAKSDPLTVGSSDHFDSVAQKRLPLGAELQLALNLIPAHTWYAAPSGALTFLNERGSDYLGLPQDHPLRFGIDTGAEWDSHIPLLHPDDHEETRRVWSTCLRTGCAGEVSFRVRNAEGGYRWFLSRAEPVRAANGTLLYWIGVNLDIEERKQAEFYLAEGQRLAHTGSWAFTPAGFEYWSSELFQIHGLDPRGNPPTKEEYLALVHPEDREFVEQQIQEMLATHRAFDFTKQIVRPDGQIRSVRCVGVLATQDGTFRRFVGTGMDVTEQEQLIEALRKSEEELRQMLDFAPQLIGVYGPNRERLYLNHVALDYLGVSLEEWRQTQRPGAFIHPDDRERELAYFARARSNGSAGQLELRLRGSDGSYRWFLARYNSVRDNNGQILRWYVSCTDIEDRKRAEERLQQENVALREEIDKASMFEEIVGTSPALQTVLSRISKVAPTDSTVLITGETGTGKELVARAIHRRSNRASRAFVSVNCAAIPRDLIASELFGHEKGAFTGAMQRRLGRFELAEGGTIFLDEVGELLPDTQVALLRVLQEREFERVGGRQSIRVDVRVVAATNRDLQAAVANGTFREDLYYRLNVFPLEMPPLRARRADIPLLVEYFIDRYGRKAGKNIRSVDKKTLQLLQSYPWPGNIRELQNIIERSVIVCESEIFTVDESWLSQQSHDERSGGKLYLSQKLAAKEKEVIEEALRESQGRVFGPSGAAAKLGIARSTLESKIQSLNINKNRFKAKPRS